MLAHQTAEMTTWPEAFLFSVIFITAMAALCFIVYLGKRR